MKKCLIFLLVITMLLSYPVFSEAETEYIVGENAELLYALGCISEESYNILKDSKNVTRGEFAKVISDIAMLEANGENLFNDVEDSYEYKDAVNAVNTRGIMKGDGNGLFNPASELKEIDAVVVILRLLGFEELAYYQGGYPTGYFNVLRNTKLAEGTGGISSSDILSNKTLAQLMKNMLDEKLLDTMVVSEGGYGKEYSNDTFLSIYYGIEKVKGIVSANTVTTLDKPIENSGIIIDGRVLVSKDKKFDSLLGYEAEAYFDKETSYLLYAVKTKRNETEIISSADIYAVTGKEIITEDENGKQTKYSMPGNAYVIYNGRAAAEYSYDIFDISNGEIRLIDNNGDRKTDIISIYSYETLVVNEVNSEERMIMFKYNGGSYDSDMLEDTVFYKNGKLSDITWINEYDALDILKSDSGEILEIHNSGRVKTLAPVSFENDGKKGWVSFGDGTTAQIVKNSSINISEIEINKTYICSFNKFGQLVSMEIKESGVIAVLLGFGERGSFEKEMVAKFYTELDSLDTYKLADKIIVNNIEKDIRKETEKNDVKNAFASAKGKPVEIALNKKGELEKISIMSIAYNSGDSSVYIYGLSATNVITAGSDAQYLSQKAKAFYIPENYTSAEKDYFKVVSTQSVGSIYRPIVAYKKLDSELPEADALVFITGGLSTTMPDYDQPAIIEKVTTAYNNAEETASSKITYWYMGARNSALLAKNDLENILSAGDISYLDIGDDGMIYGIRKFFDYSDKALSQTVSAIRSKHRAQYGSVYQTYDNLFAVTTDTLDAPGITPSYIEYHRYPNYGYVFDTVKNTVRKAWLSDFIGYTSDNTNFSKAFVFTTYMTEYVTVLYR